MENNLIVEKFINKVWKNQIISPTLFLGNNLEIINQKVEEIAKELCLKFDIPNANLFILKNNWEKIKIEILKQFLRQTNIRTPYKFQIFLIENISKMTLQSANSCLKLFEEPWVWNIIFMTNNWESWILDTILSRVQIEKFNFSNNETKDEVFIELIEKYILYKKLDLVSYFFSNKLEKDEYIGFLKTLLSYWKNNFLFIDFLEELSNDIYSIEYDSVNIRYIVDKYILKILWNYEK